jgi:nucleotide-binding universal stress UspA family protein
MKAVLSVDAFDADPQMLRRMSAALVALGFSPRDKVEAVYVASSSEPNLSLALELPPAERYGSFPLDQLKARLKERDLMGLKVKPRVVSRITPSIRLAADRLAAEAKGADLIVLQTQSRSGFQRFLLGSFAETLIHRTPVSLLVLNPTVRAKSTARRILVATDLQASAPRQVREVARWAKRAGALLHIFHVPEPSYGLRFGGQDPSGEEYRRGLPERMAALVKEAEREGIRARFSLATGLRSTADLILKEAAGIRADVITVSAKSGPLSSLFLGSVSRDLIRRSQVPVLVSRL